MFIGLLGEYVTAIHAQVRRGPMVVERAADPTSMVPLRDASMIERKSALLAVWLGFLIAGCGRRSFS